MTETWDLYDIHRDLTGETWQRGSKTQIPQGRYHVIVSVWTVTPDGLILITRRHTEKSFGGMWENTGGAVISGETSVQAAYRELSEETGLDARKGTLLFLGDVWHPGYIVDAYLYVSDIDINSLTLQVDEVTDARLVTESELDALNAEGLLVPSVYKTFCCYRSEIKDVIAGL